MDPITLILMALAAGASTGTLDALKDNAKEAVQAAYSKLRDLAGKRVSGRPHAELALAEYGSDPRKWEGLLAAELTEARAGQDAELIAAAAALMDIVDQAGARAGKYNVTVKDSRGVQVGDGNFQVNKF